MKPYSFPKINRFELKCCLEFKDCKSRKIIQTSLTNKVQEKDKWDSGIDFSRPFGHAEHGQILTGFKLAFHQLSFVDNKGLRKAI